MNKEISSLLILLLLTTGTLFAKKKELPELRRIIPMTELTPDMIEELIRGGLPDVAM